MRRTVELMASIVCGTQPSLLEPNPPRDLVVDRTLLTRISRKVS